MDQVSRRTFIKNTSLAVAAAGVATSVPLAIGSTGRHPSAARRPVAGGAFRSDEPIVAHVRDLGSGEISLFVGTRQVTFHDPEIAARLSHAAH